MNRQEILEALKNDNYYKNLSDKDFFDANNLDNLAKYLEHNFAKTDESKKVILDMLSHKKHNPSDLYDYRITQEELFNLNKKYYDNTYLYHGLNAYTTNLTDKSLDISEKIENNLYNITNNKDIELATSSTHMIGDIGIKGKGDSLFAQPWDMYSVVDKETGKRSKPREKAIITEDDIFDIIEKYQDNPKSIKSWKKHDEVIAKNFEIDSLWVKEDFYNNNQDFVLKLLKDNKIQNLDIVHSNSFEQYRDVDIERVNVNDINKEKKLTPQEAFDKYGQNEIKNKLNITEDISSERALEIIDEALDNVTYANQKVLNEERYLKISERTVADFESGRTNAENRGGYGIDYFRQQVKKRKEEVKLAKEELEGLPKQEELEELRKLYNAQIKDLPLETVDLSDFKNRNTVRYHNSKDATIIYDISGMGDNIKIENSVGHSGTWASKQEHGIKSISNWIEYNPEILEYDEQNLEKLSGYITEFKYKEDANILYIHDDKTLKRTLNKYGDGRNKISWNKVASDFDAVRIDSNPLLSLSKYQRKVLGYYGDTDVIFNPDIFETINTYNADEYFRENKKPIFTANNRKNITSQEAFDKYGPNDDRFYTSQGLDPKKQKEAINKLNSKRKPPEPLPDYSADDARLDKMFAEDKAYIESLEKQRKRPNYKPVKGPKLKNKNNNIIDKIFEFEDKYSSQNHINFNNKNIKQEFEKLSKGHDKLYSELLYRPEEYRQELSKYYEALKSDIRPFHEIPKIIGNDIEPIMSVQNIFAQEHGFESYNDMLKYASEHFDGKSSIPIKKILELKNDVKTEIPKPKPKETVKDPKPKETVKQDKNLEKATNEASDNFTENINNTPKPEIKSTPKPEIKSTPKPEIKSTPKPSKNIVKPVKNTSKMTTKSLGGVGKGAIGLIVAGVGLAIGKALSSDNDEKDKKQDKQVAKQQNISYNNQYIDNQYAMQMAQDISSYRYGKHMTGFVNF